MTDNEGLPEINTSFSTQRRRRDSESLEGLNARQIGQRRRRERERINNDVQTINLRDSESLEGLNARQIGQRRRRERERMNNDVQTINLLQNRITATPPLTDIAHLDSGIPNIGPIDLSHGNITFGRHFLGSMDVACPYCSALHWMDEKLTNSSTVNPLFGTCCLQGKIRLPLLRTPPPPLQALYDGASEQSKSFLSHIREYNSANAFTSLGAKMDSRVISGRGPNSFTIHGELRHRTGALLPQPGHEPVYAQLYIYDPTSALENRSRRNPHLRRDVLQIVQDCLLEHNPFSSIYRQASEVLVQTNVAVQNIPVCLHYSSTTDKRRYNLPTTGDIAVIIPGDGSEISGMRGIVLHLRGNNGLLRINECHPAYLPLHYVLFFPYGELGWEPEMKLWDVVRGQPSTSRLTQMDFYSYHLFERPTEYSSLLRGNKLFQEFMVDGWAATEQNRLNYYKQNQGKLRADLYNNLTDVALDGLGTNQIGQ